MILIGIGSNLPAPRQPTPLATVQEAVAALAPAGVSVTALSGWYLSEPVPTSDQPWYANGVLAAATKLPPQKLLDSMLAVEARFGRKRSVANAARTLDLDLLDYDGRVIETARLTLPHPRLHERRFVLVPLCDIAPEWRHPVLGETAAALLARLPPGQPIRRVRDDGAPCP